MAVVAIALVAAGALAWAGATRSGAPTHSAAAPVPAAHPTTDRERLLVAAYSLRGVPYRWGGKTPAGLDCSGFTKLAYAKVGLKIPDGSYNQEGRARPLVSASQLATGDLIFYRWKPGQAVGHVTMYAGSGWLIGTGSPGQAHAVSVFPLADDMVADGRVLTYRHIVLADER